MKRITIVGLFGACLGAFAACQNRDGAEGQSAAENFSLTAESPYADAAEVSTVIPSMASDQRVTDVVINGRGLSEAEVGEFAMRYGVRPHVGQYWYDTRSGLYGIAGQAALGFMYPGHAYGDLGQGASNGDTGVIVNGRELPQSEWFVLSQVVGAPVAAGAYWLDANGNAGYEGSAQTLVNLYAAAASSGYGAGGGGDNQWSSRFGAGNSNADNSAGYVSVPGYGPIGYGF